MHLGFPVRTGSISTSNRPWGTRTAQRDISCQKYGFHSCGRAANIPLTCVQCCVLRETRLFLFGVFLWLATRVGPSACLTCCAGFAASCSGGARAEGECSLGTSPPATARSRAFFRFDPLERESPQSLSRGPGSLDALSPKSSRLLAQDTFLQRNLYGSGSRTRPDFRESLREIFLCEH